VLNSVLTGEGVAAGVCTRLGFVEGGKNESCEAGIFCMRGLLTSEDEPAGEGCEEVGLRVPNDCGKYTSSRVVGEGGADRCGPATMYSCARFALSMGI
jgi:hypothetical protein